MASPGSDSLAQGRKPLTPRRLAGAIAYRAQRIDRFVSRNFIRRPASLSHEARMVTFTFDDFPQSAADRGGEILAKHDARGTFYACLGLLGKQSPGGVLVNEPSLTALAEEGHEVGCHTYTHLDFTKTAGRRIREDLQTNRDKAVSLGMSLTNFAYPYGQVGAMNKGKVRDLYASARATRPQTIRGAFDAAELPSISLDTSTDYSGLRRYLDEVSTLGGWAIFFSHDVSPQPSRGGVTPQQLEQLVADTKARGLDIVTVAAATALFSKSTS